MPEAPLTKADSGDVENIDAHFRPTHDEFARMRFVMGLRNHALMNLRFSLRDEFDRAELPKFKKAHGRAPKSGAEVAKAMKENTFFQTYSSMRYNAQEMNHHARMPAIERGLPEMIDVARHAAKANPAGGSLRLDPVLEIPRYVSAIDVHLKPGCYQSEFTADDVAQGVEASGMPAVKAEHSRNSAAAVNPARNFAGVGASVATWVSRKFPDFKPRRILDIATGTARNLLGYHEVFPDAELYGLDVAAPGLRYGFAKAAHEGIAVHLSQQNAEATDFPDGHFDLIVSSFFFHETSNTALKRILSECHRLLSKGGIMAHMELPPHKACDPILNFLWDWDTKGNNEPFYATFRSLDPVATCAAAGFPRKSVFEVTVPDVTVPSFKMADYPKYLSGELKAPRHGGGGWFIFGARKA